jgi:hypothetical protein
MLFVVCWPMYPITTGANMARIGPVYQLKFLYFEIVGFLRYSFVRQKYGQE